MITLKKSFELQNYFKELQTTAINLLCSDFMILTKRYHFIKDANSEAEDKEEVIESLQRDKYNVTPNQLIDFSIYIMNERTRLHDAIAKAKHSGEYDFDSLIAQNSERRQLLNVFKMVCNMKSKESRGVGRGNKFNVNGEQISYTYETKDVVTIDFDRNKVKGILSNLRKQCDNVSDEIDKILITREVDFNTVFEAGDDFDDAVTKFLEIQK